MSKKDWVYSKDGQIMNPYYGLATPAERQILEAITDILFDVTYAKSGNKATARRKAALEILYAIKTAYKLHRGNDLLTTDFEPSAGHSEAPSDPKRKANT